MQENCFFVLRRSPPTDLTPSPRWEKIGESEIELAQPPPMSYLTGDIVTIISIDYISDIVHHAERLWLVRDNGIPVQIFIKPKLTHRNWLAAWESPETDALTMVNCLNIVENTVAVTMLSSVIKRIYKDNAVMQRWVAVADQWVAGCVGAEDARKYAEEAYHEAVDSPATWKDPVGPWQFYALMKLMICDRYQIPTFIKNAIVASIESDGQRIAAMIRDHIPLHVLLECALKRLD